MSRDGLTMEISNNHSGDRGSIVDAPSSETMVINGQTVTVPLAGVVIGGLSSVSDAINQIDSVSRLIQANHLNANFFVAASCFRQKEESSRGSRHGSLQRLDCSSQS
jgi:hypothetical protein